MQWEWSFNIWHIQVEYVSASSLKITFTSGPLFNLKLSQYIVLGNIVAFLSMYNNWLQFITLTHLMLVIWEVQILSASIFPKFVLYLFEEWIISEKETVSNPFQIHWKMIPESIERWFLNPFKVHWKMIHESISNPLKDDSWIHFRSIERWSLNSFQIHWKVIPESISGPLKDGPWIHWKIHWKMIPECI